MVRSGFGRMMWSCGQNRFRLKEIVIRKSSFEEKLWLETAQDYRDCGQKTSGLEGTWSESFQDRLWSERV